MGSQTPNFIHPVMNHKWNNYFYCKVFEAFSAVLLTGLLGRVDGATYQKQRLNAARAGKAILSPVLYCAIGNY